MNNNLLASLQSAPADERVLYVAPSIEIIDVVTEGVIAGSFTGGGLPDIGNGGSAYSSRRSTYRGASSSDIEDMLNDILTIEQ